MTKRLVDIDDDLLQRARIVSGSATIKGTVEEALRRMVASDLTRRHLELLRDPGFLNMDALEEARRPRG